MGASRKLQGEIDRVLKKVQEGVELFDSIWNKVYDTDNANQKEKYEADLKKEIKKLQRYRDQIKTWIQSSEIKDKKVSASYEQALLDARKQIEREMERFKICEKETKTKAFSKEGLVQQPKTDPKEKAKSETRDWINNVVGELESQVDAFEAELEGLSVKKGKTRPPRLTHLETSITRHKAHILKMELILRLLDNDELSPEQVNDVKDFLEDYVERNQDDFEEFSDVDELYSSLPLDKVEALEDLVVIGQPGHVNCSLNQDSLDSLSSGNCLQAEKENKFSVYVHSRPGFVFSTSTTKSVYFLNRQVNNSIEVVWGEASMIQAERILLENALSDPFNERFVFLSDSCIPLYNFSYTYEYIMSASSSFVDSFADTKDERYNPKMHPIIPIQNWRKGSQWVVLIRKHAEVVAKDEKVFPIFQQHCKRKSLPEFWRHRHLPAHPWKEHNCIPDEHYVPTLLAQEHLEGEITRRSLSHSAWDLSSSKDSERQGWHPLAYKFSDATSQLIQSIKDIDNIYYETEYRREWCSSKGRPSRCFLFARKFTRPAALRLYNMSVIGSLN